MVVRPTLPKIPLKTPPTPQTPQMLTYWKFCPTTIRPLLTWNSMAALQRHSHLQQHPSIQHRPRQFTQQHQKLTYLSSTSHLVTLAPIFLVHNKGHPSTNQAKLPSEHQNGHCSTPSVTGRLRTGQKCMGHHHRQWKSFLQYQRCVLTD